MNDDLVFVHMKKNENFNKTEAVLETERLFLREMNMGDYDALYQVLCVYRVPRGR